jgi:uncharacterized protein
MIVDLNSFEEYIEINSLVTIPYEFYKDTEIISIGEVEVVGRISFSDYDNILIDLNVNGIMILSDSVTLEDIEYPFNIEIEENIDKNSEETREYYQKDKNTLDITTVLWENIVLEVPIRVTNGYNKDISLKGEGWELVDENKKEIDPRLAPLQELLDKREE